jgi:hypothetical protein
MVMNEKILKKFVGCTKTMELGNEGNFCVRCN